MCQCLEVVVFHSLLLLAPTSAIIINTTTLHTTKTILLTEKFKALKPRTKSAAIPYRFSIKIIIMSNVMLIYIMLKVDFGSQIHCRVPFYTTFFLKLDLFHSELDLTVWVYSSECQNIISCRKFWHGARIPCRKFRLKMPFWHADVWTQCLLQRVRFDLTMIETTGRCMQRKIRALSCFWKSRYTLIY